MAAPVTSSSGAHVKLFEKKLEEKDISQGLNLDAGSLVRAPEFNLPCSLVDFKVRDEEGFTWSFRCFKNWADSTAHPVVCGGWADFVRHKSLRVKDKVIFYANHQDQDQDGVAHFVVHVRRTIRLFGVDITEAD